MADHHIPPLRLVELVASGARLFDASTGRDVGRAVRQQFDQQLPRCNGDRAAAAAQAVNAVLGDGAERKGG